MESPLTKLVRASKQHSDCDTQYKRAIIAADMAAECKSSAEVTEFTESEKRAKENATRALMGYTAAALHVLLNEKIVVVNSLEEVEALKAVLVEFPKPFKLKRVKINDGASVEEMREVLIAAKFQLLEENTYSIPE